MCEYFRPFLYKGQTQSRQLLSPVYPPQKSAGFHREKSTPLFVISISNRVSRTNGKRRDNCSAKNSSIRGDGAQYLHARFHRRTIGTGKNNRPSRARERRIYAGPSLKISTSSPDINTCHVHCAALARKHTPVGRFRL